MTDQRRQDERKLAEKVASKYEAHNGLIRKTMVDAMLAYADERVAAETKLAHRRGWDLALRKAKQLCDKKWRTDKGEIAGAICALDYCAIDPKLLHPLNNSKEAVAMNALGEITSLAPAPAPNP